MKRKVFRWSNERVESLSNLFSENKLSFFLWKRKRIYKGQFQLFYIQTNKEVLIFELKDFGNALPPFFISPNKEKIGSIIFITVNRVKKIADNRLFKKGGAIFFVSKQFYMRQISSFNRSSSNLPKWSNALKQFVGNNRRIVWVYLTILWGWCFKG